jgi:hypothetical protein
MLSKGPYDLGAVDKSSLAMLIEGAYINEASGKKTLFVISSAAVCLVTQ